MRPPTDLTLEFDRPFRAEVRPELELDYVSPLPPVRSGISDYSVDLLPHLDRLCSLRVIHLDEQPIAEDVAARWTPTPSPATGEDGRLPLYQMGNNLHHEQVFGLAMERPGVLVLHDLILHHFLLGRTMGRGDYWGYREELVEEHGWIGDMASLPMRWGGIGNASQFALPARRRLLRRQRGVLVHSEWGAEQILEDEPDLHVRTIQMGIPLPDVPDEAAARAFREKHGLPLDKPLLGSFGFQTPMKRTSSVVAALARPELQDVHLIVAGEVTALFNLEGWAEEAGVEDRVHITGFLDYDEFEAAITACDLCVNLRYPTAGETSASLLRVLALGRPTLVSDYAQFADLPDQITVKIPLGTDEEEAIAARAGELLAQPARLARMGELAREYIAHYHDPARAASEVVEACWEWRDAEPPGDAPVEVERPTSVAWSQLVGDLEVEDLAMPWAVGEARQVRFSLTNRGWVRWLATQRGPGGVFVEVAFMDEDRKHLEGIQWLEIPRDLDQDDTWDFETEVRRPPEAAFLAVTPRVGRTSFFVLGGPYWIKEI